MSGVWITRSRPGAERTAHRVRAMGLETVVAPLLETRPLPGGDIDLVGIGALAFTSANGVDGFAARAGGRDLPVFAVGSGTAAAARASGFTRVETIDGDVAALAALVARRGVAGPVLHPSATVLAGDLTSDLARRGIACRALAVYETVAADLDDADWRRIASAGIALLHSPKAARALLAAAQSGRRIPPRAICLSAAVAAPLVKDGAQTPSIAATPTEDALLDALGRAVAARADAP